MGKADDEPKLNGRFIMVNPFTFTPKSKSSQYKFEAEAEIEESDDEAEDDFSEDSSETPPNLPQSLTELLRWHTDFLLIGLGEQLGLWQEA